MRAPLVLALSVSVAGLAASVPTLVPTANAPADPGPRPGGLVFPPFKGGGGSSYGWVGGFPRPGVLPGGTVGSLSVQTFQVSTSGTGVIGGGGGDTRVAAPGDAALLVAPGRIGTAFGGTGGGGTAASSSGGGSTTANGTGGGAVPPVAAAAAGGVLEGDSFMAAAAATPAGDSTSADMGVDGGFGMPGGGFGIPGAGGSNSGGPDGGSGAGGGNGLGNPPRSGGGGGITPDLANNPTLVSDIGQTDPDVLISSVVSAVPEAPSLALFGVGLLGLAWIRRPRRRG